MRRRIRIGTIVVLAVSGLGAYSAFAALQSADLQKFIEWYIGNAKQ